MFKFTNIQQKAKKLLASAAQHILLRGGSRSGKTFIILFAIVVRALCAPGSRHAVLGFRFNRVKTAIGMDTFPKMMSLCFPGVSYHLDKQEWFYQFNNGSEIWLCGLDDQERTEKVLGKEFCVHPDSMVLMADLTWRRAEDVARGDEIIAFPENLDGHMKLISSVIEWNKPLIKKRYKIVTNKGSTIVSEGHKFVAIYDDRRVRNFRSMSWRSIEELQPGDKLRFAITPWTQDKSFDGGWLSGIYDGEGWVSKNGQVGVAQNAGLVLNKIKSMLDDRGFYVRQHISQKCVQFISLNMWDAMHIIGSLRPVRLLQKKDLLWKNKRGFDGHHGNSAGSSSRHKINVESRHVAEILSIEEIDTGVVRSIQTSSKTLITDGFLSHNCTIFFNECSQISADSRETAMSRLAQKVMVQTQGESDRELRLKAYYDENPPKKSHWSYKLFFKKINPTDGTPVRNPDDYVTMLMNPKDNEENLPEGYMETLNSLSAAKRRRFRDGEFAESDPNQLFDEDTFEKYRVIDLDELPDMIRFEISVDPSGIEDGEEESKKDPIGIMAGGVGTDGIAYIMEDLTVSAGPTKWGKIAVNAYHYHNADRIIGETNFGGGMVKFVIRTIDPHVPFKTVTATKGKHIRAEPIAALYEQGRVRHVGHLTELEAEYADFTTHGYNGARSPNRADAAIWLLFDLFPELMPKQKDEAEIETFEAFDSGVGY